MLISDSRSLVKNKGAANKPWASPYRATLSSPRSLPALLALAAPDLRSLLLQDSSKN